MIFDIINLSQLTSPGLVLDVSRGGEGIIGALLGRQVVAIDILQGEREEMSNDGSKPVMDAEQMSFLGESFDEATCFFSLMYMSPRSLKHVLSEIFRVLTPGGRLQIWGAEIPAGKEGDGLFTIELDIIARSRAHSRTFKAKYEIDWPRKSQDHSTITRPAWDCGFEPLGHASTGRTFHLTLLKPYSSGSNLICKVPTKISPMRIFRATAKDMHDSYDVLIDSCRRVVERGRPVPSWLFTAEGQQHVAEKIRGCDYFIGYISESPVAVLWIKWADSHLWGDAGYDGLAGYVHSFGVKQVWAGVGAGKALLEWASSYIASKGRRLIRLECDAGNPALCAYYERLGFEDKGLAALGNHLRRYERSAES